MSRFGPIAPRAIRSTTAPSITSASRFRWQGRFASLDALTGQAGTLTRASTSTALATDGATVTIGHSQPRWEARAFTGSLAFDTLGLRMTTDDLTWPCAWVPTTGTLLVDFQELGTRTTANATLVAIGNDSSTGAYLRIDSNGTNYGVILSNGSATTTVSLTGAIPATNAGARLVVHLLDTGGTQSVRIAVAPLTTGVVTQTAYSSTIARAATWGASASVRANRFGSAGTQGSTWLRQIAWCDGILTGAEIAARL